MAFEIKAAGYTIHGPVKGLNDLHQSFTVYQDDGPVLASFYAAGGDLKAAEDNAKTFCAAHEAKKELQSIEKGECQVFDEDTNGYVEQWMGTDEMQALARHALQQF
jgi:hypothetical protein